MTDNTRPTIGFIGLGLMGSAMVNRLLDLGYSVNVLGNRSRERIEAAIARGAVEQPTAKDIAANSDIVMLCMGTSAQVESRVFGEDGVISGAKEGTLVIDFGTSQPESTKHIGAELNKAGVRYMDAPLGRTPSHALDGLLNIMAAGSAEDFKEVEPVLNDLGENVYHLGELGCGHTLKLINNFFAMTVATAMSEAFAMADKAGIERGQLYNVMSAGPTHSLMMDFVKANAVDGDPNMLGFAIENACKDLTYFTAMAESMDTPSFIGPATQQALSKATESGYGGKNVPTMVDFFADTFK